MKLRRVQHGIISYSLDHPQDNQYNMGICFRLSGSFDLAALAQASSVVFDAVPIFRYAFEKHGTQVQAVDHGLLASMQCPPRISVQDVAGWSAEAIEAAAAEHLARPIDLRESFPIRITFFRSGPDQAHALYVVHHGVADLFSARALIDRVGEAYRSIVAGEAFDARVSGAVSRPPRFPAAGRDIAALRAMLPDDVSSYLPDSVEPTGPAWRKRTAVTLSDAERAGLDALCMRHATGRAALLLALCCVVRARVTGERRFVLTLPLSGRTRAERALVGCFVNVLPVFVDLDRHVQLASLCADLDAQARRLLRHQHVSIADYFSDVIDAGSIGVMRHCHDTLATRYSGDLVLDLPGATTHCVALASTNFRYPFHWVAWDFGTRIHLEINTSTERFLHADIAGHVHEVLQAWQGDAPFAMPGRALAPDTPQHACLARTIAPVATLNGEFRRQAARWPDRVAITHRGHDVRYRELAARVDHFAAALAERIAPDCTEVIVSLARGVDLIAILLAVLELGRAYVPIKPGTPAERLACVLEDLSAPHVVTQAQDVAMYAALPGTRVSTLEALLARGAESAVAAREAACVTPQHDAYVIFTSGSTGRPKGVWVSHANATRLFSVTREHFAFDERDTWLLFHSYAFDFSVWEIFGALTRGARLVIADREDCPDFDRIADLVLTERVTVLNQTPAVFAGLAASLLAHPDLTRCALREVIFGGERLDASRLAAWVAAMPLERVRLTNMYGITETTVHVTLHTLGAADLTSRASCIGRPLDDLSVYVIDEGGRLAAVGEIGELVIAGPGLSNGYRAAPALMSRAFVANTIEPRRFERMYRSGDLGRYRPDGTLEYLGRRDRQVQLHGYRIELPEIEAALLACEGVGAASVICVSVAGGAAQLVAFVVPAAGADRAGIGQTVRRDLAGRLPRYMVPAHLLVLHAIPTTSNGKVDQAALERAFLASVSGDAAPLAPDGLGRRVAAVWQAVLGFEPTSDTIGFFDAGGDSLAVNELVIGLRRLLPAQLAPQVSVAGLFDHASIRGQTEWLTRIASGTPAFAHGGADTVSASEARSSRRRVVPRQGGGRTMRAEGN